MFKKYLKRQNNKIVNYIKDFKEFDLKYIYN